ncbi:LPXTG cell wall anchor domain-containing protein [Nocardioides sp. zg-DK7169]|nr:LPXTG cell wall anchor domain-containing protein [Nocardioides sp. zg-DK7169]
MKRMPTMLAKLAAGAAAMMLVTIVNAPPSFAAPTLEVSQLEGLTDGQVLTVSGEGYEPGLSGIAVGQCVEGYAGPADCNLPNGSTFRTADENGSIGEFTVTVNEKFGDHDCTVVQCYFASGPIPNAVDEATYKANVVEHKISFGAPAAPAEPAPAEPTTAPAATTPTTGGTALPKTGGGDSMPVVLLSGSALLLLGLGVIVAFPGRGRTGVAQ